MSASRLGPSLEAAASPLGRELVGRLREFGQELRKQCSSARTQQCLAQHVLQLTNVAGPRVVAQAVHRRGGDLDDLPPEFSAQSAHVMSYQHRQVIAPLAQRWKLDRKRAETVIQVGPESSFLQPRFEVAMGRCDQPHIGPDGLVASDSLERLLMQDAEELCLQARGMSPTSSRKMVPLLHCSNLPMRRRSAPVKAPFSCPNNSLSSSVSGMAAQLTPGTAIEPAAVLIDGPGDQLFAGTALAGDQHGDVLAGDLADCLVDLAHRRARAEDPASTSASGGTSDDGR